MGHPRRGRTLHSEARRHARFHPASKQGRSGLPCWLPCRPNGPSWPGSICTVRGAVPAGRTPPRSGPWYLLGLGAAPRLWLLWRPTLAKVGSEGAGARATAWLPGHTCLPVLRALASERPRCQPVTWGAGPLWVRSRQGRALLSGAGDSVWGGTVAPSVCVWRFLLTREQPTRRSTGVSELTEYRTLLVRCPLRAAESFTWVTRLLGAGPGSPPVFVTPARPALAPGASGISARAWT